MGTVTVGQTNWPPVQAVVRGDVEPGPSRCTTAVDHHRSGSHPALTAPVGRTTALGFVLSLLDDMAGGGSPLVVSGEQGIGKTALLDAAQVAAVERGIRTLRVNGAEFEADIDLAGLHQLLVPLSGEINALPDRARHAIETARDLGGGDRPDRLVVLNAVFALLREVAGRTPTMVIVDDAQWIDRASSEALAFVARRLTGLPVGLLVAMREGSESLLGRVGLPTIRLRPPIGQPMAMDRRRVPARNQGVGRTLIEGGDLFPNNEFRAKLTIAPRVESVEQGWRSSPRLEHVHAAPTPSVAGHRTDRRLRAATAKSADLLYRDGEVDHAHIELVTAIESSTSGPDADRAGLVQALHLLAEVCHYGGRAEQWVPFRRAVHQLGDDVPPVLRLLERTCPDPFAVSAADLADLDRQIKELRHADPDPVRTVHVAMAAYVVDKLPGCREALRQVFRGAGDEGADDCAVRAGLLLALDAVDAGRWTEAHTVAEECVELCQAGGRQLLGWTGRGVLALLAAGRGQWQLCQALTNEMLEWATPRGARGLIREAHHARRLAFLGRGDLDDGPAPSPGPVVSPGAVGAGAVRTSDPHVRRHGLDLVEAAVRTRQHAAAADHATALAVACAEWISPRLALQVAGAKALVAPDVLADALFRAALDIPRIEQWPFEVARVRLAFGERLRRQRATRASREQLAVALDMFTRLGARPWADRAGAELRATGQTRRRPVGNDPAPLTPQELEIAELAATGLTNKEIGARMFVSPRTVSAHLYRVFPKLGITSRAALRDALLALASG